MTFKDEHPCVSVVTAAFNCEKTIRRCLESVQRQTFSNWEHIVVDDGSTDGTAALLADFARSDPRIRVLRTARNGGAAVARNQALKEARGRFIAFIDADDEWLPEKLETQIRFMAENDVHFSYGAYFIVPPGQEGRRLVFTPPGSLTYRDLLKGCPVGCSSVVFDRGAIGIEYMPHLRRGQDWALWLKLARRTDRIAAYPGVHVIYHRSKGSLSSGKLKKIADVWGVYKRCENLGTLPSLKYFACHAYYRLVRKRERIAYVSNYE